MNVCNTSMRGPACWSYHIIVQNGYELIFISVAVILGLLYGLVERHRNTWNSSKCMRFRVNETREERARDLGLLDNNNK